MVQRARRRWIVAAVVLGLLFAAGIFVWNWTQPLIALGRLKSAIQARSETDVARYVDFEALKTNVVDHVGHRIEQKNEDKFLGGLRTRIEGLFAEIAVEKMATPSGLIHLSCDTDAHGDVDFSPKPPGAPCSFDVDLKGFEYLTPTRFRVSAAQSKGGSDIKLILDRGADAQWRLVALTDSGPLSK